MINTTFTEDTFKAIADSFYDGNGIEPLRFTYRGIHCIIANFFGTPQGYLVFDRDTRIHRILADNPGVTDEYDDTEAFLALPMEITLDEEREGQRVIGFDTNHSWDYDAKNRDPFRTRWDENVTDESIRNAKLPSDIKVWTVYDVKDVLCDSIDMIMDVFSRYDSHIGKRAIAQLNKSSFD